jgi:glycosyltransferase involved in cell wall biosynthesis
MVGTIEPRKNHLLILNVWRALRAELGADTPRLILIGDRGWENENIVDMLERSPALQGFVEERSRISDEEMIQIVSGARALIMPSFAEGYGLPLADTLALGVPALCSDIPTLREIGGDVPEFLDPLDGVGWRSAIIDYLDGTSGRRQAQLQRLVEWQPPRWDDHFSRISNVLKALTS